MSYTIANIVTHAQDLVCDGADSTELTNIVTTLLEDELPANGFGGDVFLAATTAGTAAYTVSTTLRKLEAVCCAGRELSRETLATLDAQGPTWKDTVGSPLAYTAQLEADRTIRLYPAPDFTSAGPSSTTTEIDRILYLATAVMSSIPSYLRLPAALWALAREYERESDHRDLAFAKLARAMAEKFFLLAEGV